MGGFEFGVWLGIELNRGATSAMGVVCRALATERGAGVSGPSPIRRCGWANRPLVLVSWTL